MISTAKSNVLFRKRIMSIDIIKGIAMLMVIMVHYNQSFTAANISIFKFFQMGCSIFFMASGFGVANSFTNKAKHNTMSKAIKDFYASRLKAIAPAWWLMMAVVFLTNTIVIRKVGHTLSFGRNRSLVGLICNALFLQGLIPFCNNNVMPGGWYIGTTMILYALSPIIVILFTRYSPVRVCIATSVMSILSVMGITYAAYRIDPRFVAQIVTNNSFGYFSFLTQYPSFGIGILLYFVNRDNKKVYAVAELIIGSILMACAVCLFFNPFFLFSYIFCASLVGLSSYFILNAMISFENAGKCFNGILLKPIVSFGKESLFVFLVHAFFEWPFVSVVKGVISNVGLNSDTYIIYVLLLPVVVSLSYFSGAFLKRVVNWTVSRMSIIFQRT